MQRDISVYRMEVGQTQNSICGQMEIAANEIAFVKTILLQNYFCYNFLSILLQNECFKVILLFCEFCKSHFVIS